MDVRFQCDFYLNIRFIYLEKLCPDTCGSEQIYLDHNNLTDLDSVLHPGMYNVDKLYLSHNPFTRVTENSFNGKVDRVSHIGLDNCLIQEFNVRHYMGLRNLWGLELNYNLIDKIINSWNSHFTSIRVSHRTVLLIRQFLLVLSTASPRIQNSDQNFTRVPILIYKSISAHLHLIDRDTLIVYVRSSFFCQGRTHAILQVLKGLTAYPVHVRLQSDERMVEPIRFPVPEFIYLLVENLLCGR
ncbi:hypothetical protein CEXT_571911 [Caerostris extrusa]|uniref:Uncharacterized protein n=1 Tax=Caerostris extrusa TaxID=172846 RepID=A0AAV4TSR0_CAEEX|nr:hypothetical protein CEXT_571911 [Caerostris extrusa]